MDLTAIVFYAAVCGVHSMAAPNMGGRVSRLTIGAVVGIVAAAVLPIVRGFFG